MKLYLLSQNHVNGWDTYDSCVVAAKSEADARTIHPSHYVTHHSGGRWKGTYDNETGGEYDQDNDSGWVRFADIDKIVVEFIGTTKEGRGVICASYNAG